MRVAKLLSCSGRRFGPEARACPRWEGQASAAWHPCLGSSVNNSSQPRPRPPSWAWWVTSKSSMRRRSACNSPMRASRRGPHRAQPSGQVRPERPVWLREVDGLQPADLGQGQAKTAQGAQHPHTPQGVLVEQPIAGRAATGGVNEPHALQPAQRLDRQPSPAGQLPDGHRGGVAGNGCRHGRLQARSVGPTGWSP